MQNNAQKKRETCFLKIVRERITTGKFFVEADGCEDDILVQLETDEIITRDPNTGSYFITHDIYEEWGLDLSELRTRPENGGKVSPLFL
jgi:hypothetical protein